MMGQTHAGEWLGQPLPASKHVSNDPARFGANMDGSGHRKSVQSQARHLFMEKDQGRMIISANRSILCIL